MIQVAVLCNALLHLSVIAFYFRLDKCLLRLNARSVRRALRLSRVLQERGVGHRAGKHWNHTVAEGEKSGDCTRFVVSKVR